MNIGHLSDVHISSRQPAYKGKRASVIPGVDAADSPPVAEMANNNADNFFSLLTQAAQGTDLLVITGDLYDHLHNFHPASRDTSTTGKLWEAMYLESVKDLQGRPKEYPYGIDAVAVYSLLVYCYTKLKKPVLLVSGNHEAYEYPYGISPRVMGQRANDGIPLDHNLTFYEAILLYGPGYKTILKSANFNAANFDWFSTVFSPLADVVHTYKEQTIVALQWGEGEDFLYNPTPIDKYGLGEGGTLPRATKSVNPSQQRLVETALTGKGQKIFCSHFTLVNYALDVPLSREGRVGFGDRDFSRYEHGTTKSGRAALHGNWLARNKFHLTLSGHSHRVGLYKCDSAGGHLATRGYHPDDPAAEAAAWGDRTRVFVGASVGPIPKQNLGGEMSGQGMEYPSAAKIILDGSTPKITLLKSQSPTAKPRFAVACDYIDLMGGGFWEYFRATGSGGEFEMKVHWEKIHPNLTDAAKEGLIESVTLWLVGGMGSSAVTTESKYLQGDALRFTFSSDIQSEIEFFGESLGAIFLSLKFDGKAVSHLPGFKDYDYGSPWNIQVGIYDNKGREVAPPRLHNSSWLSKSIERIGIGKASSDPSTWQIMRHQKDGEVPSFLWRYRIRRSEFDTTVDMPK